MPLIQGQSPDVLLVVVDVQEKLVGAIPEFKSTQAGMLSALQIAETLNFRTLITEQYPKGLGSTIEPVKEALPSHAVHLEKNTFSCWDNEQFRDYVYEKKPDALLVTGIEAHICVQQTALDTVAAGFQCVVPVDAVCSRKDLDQTTAFELMRSKGVAVTTLEAAAFDLLRGADHPAFKAVSKIFKDKGATNTKR